MPEDKSETLPGATEDNDTVNTLDNAPLPPITGEFGPVDDVTGGSRPKTSNPSFREPNKLPRLISAGTSAKYQTDIKDNKLEEALEEDEEEEKHEENGEVVKTNNIEDEADDGIEADDEAEVTDVRVDEDEKDSNKSQDSGLVEKQSDEADHEDKEEDKPEEPETQSKKEEETPTTNGEHDHSHLEGKNFASCCLHN